MVPGSRVQDADGPGVYWWRVGTSLLQLINKVVYTPVVLQSLIPTASYTR